jgi:hypothetical protein
VFATLTRLCAAVAAAARGRASAPLAAPPSPPSAPADVAAAAAAAASFAMRAWSSSGSAELCVAERRKGTSPASPPSATALGSIAAR